jgi:Holliday junction resolvasome RuvABC endonuclease subunit
MTRRDDEAVLLAIDAGLRETGWAIFRCGQPVRLRRTGVIVVPGRRRVDAKVRVAHLVQCLDALVEEWGPGAVVCSEPSGIHWPVPALELLDAGLTEWSERRRLRVYTYTAQEVRLAIAGHPNVSKDQLAYAVMVRLGLIGQGKTTHEWEAVAVGDYHLRRSS